jgi:hypothetical protein
MPMIDEAVRGIVAITLDGFVCVGPLNTCVVPVETSDFPFQFCGVFMGFGSIQ